jgi:hypothetical protein
MAEDKPDLRAERLKAALRANLRRRKAQERGRSASEAPATQRDDTTQASDDRTDGEPAAAGPPRR